MYSSFYSTPLDYSNMQKAVCFLKENYCQLKVFPIGKSVLGREINALCIGNPAGATLFVGATHGLEWISTMLLLHFCEKILIGLCTGGNVSDIDVSRALKSRSLVIIPCLNPDGVDIAINGSAGALHLGDFVEDICGGQYDRWQANANGVDLNHNFDAGWCIVKEMEQNAGITSPAPTRYGGKHPSSEPETRAVTTFCMTYQPRCLYSFHSQGEEIYYSYGEHTPCRSKLMAQILASSSGYNLAKPPAIAGHGGLKDWFIEKLRRPGFTIEIGNGKNPLPITDFEKIYQKTEELLIIATLL